MTQSELARRLGVKQPSVSQWVRLQTRPESHLRKAIERELGISADDWMTDSEREIADGSGPLPTDDVDESPARNGTDDG